MKKVIKTNNVELQKIRDNYSKLKQIETLVCDLWLNSNIDLKEIKTKLFDFSCEYWEKVCSYEKQYIVEHLKN